MSWSIVKSLPDKRNVSCSGCKLYYAKVVNSVFVSCVIVRLRGHTQRIRGLQQCVEYTNEVSLTPWSTLKSSGKITVLMKMYVLISCRSPLWSLCVILWWLITCFMPKKNMVSYDGNNCEIMLKGQKGVLAGWFRAPDSSSGGFKFSCLWNVAETLKKYFKKVTRICVRQHFQFPFPTFLIKLHHKLPICDFCYQNFLNCHWLFCFQGINPIIAKKMIDDRSRSYMNARRVAKVKSYVFI